MTVILRLIGAALSVYMLLLFIRILLSWFSGPSRDSAPIQLLYRVTDPYLAWFRRFSFLQIGRMDFSPIAGIITLVIVLNIVNTLAVFGKITVGIVLALVVSAAGSAVFFIIGFLLILMVIRAISSLVGAGSSHLIWQTLDSIVTPVATFIHKTFFRNRAFTYQTGLIVATGVLAVVFFLGRYLLNWFVDLLSSIPF